MTKSKGLTGPRGLVTAAFLLFAGLLLVAVCIRVTLSEILPADSPASMRVAPSNPNAVLKRAMTALVQHRGILDVATLAAVRQAAAAAPLDGRPYIILGHQQLLDRQPARALATFEAGQRLDPRQRLVHVLLLDRYFRTGRYADAAPQLAVLTRLIGQSPAIAAALGKMMLSPETREAAIRTLRTDASLEQAVLMALARYGTTPETIFALASPSARANARQPGSWGPILVDHLVAQRRFQSAKSVWRQVYDVTDATSPIFNTAFRPSPAAAPFNWTLVADSLGAVDMKAGGLAIDYYGRESGDLANQLLILAPGAYVFSFVVDPGKSDASSRLLWSLTCVGADHPLMTAPIAAGPTSRRLLANFTVPANCPAQKLALLAEAGDFPAPNSVTVRDPQIRGQAEAHP